MKMLTLICVIMMIALAIKLFTLCIRATWGIAKILLSFVVLPVVIIGLLIGGLVYLAIPVLIIVGIIALIDGK